MEKIFKQIILEKIFKQIILEKIFKQIILEKIFKQIILEKIFKQIFFDQSEVLLHSWTNSRSAYKLLARKMQVMVSPNSDWSRTEHQSCAHG